VSKTMIVINKSPSQNHLVFRRCPSLGSLEATQHNASLSGCFHSDVSCGEAPTLLGLLKVANLDSWISF
jgi:hypothetical protein